VVRDLPSRTGTPSLGAMKARGAESVLKAAWEYAVAAGARDLLSGDLARLILEGAKTVSAADAVSARASTRARSERTKYLLYATGSASAAAISGAIALADDASGATFGEGLFTGLNLGLAVSNLVRAAGTSSMNRAAVSLQTESWIEATRIAATTEPGGPTLRRSQSPTPGLRQRNSLRPTPSSATPNQNIR
jgi:hypothetical protein